MLQAAVGDRTLTHGELLAADVNNNSDVTALDASYILQHAVDLITMLFNGRNNIWALASSAVATARLIPIVPAKTSWEL